MTAFEEFIKNQVKKIHYKTLENQEIKELLFENERGEEKLTKKFTCEENQIFLEILSKKEKITRLHEIECYQQGFLDALAVAAKRF